MRNQKFIKYTSKTFALIMSAIMAAGTVLPVQAARHPEEKAQAVEKTETVYVVADASGKASQVTVSEWLQNHAGSATLEDSSELSDIKNVKGDETFTKKGDGTFVWDAKGEDIYYQGTTDKELPVSVKVTYYLDGKEIAPEKLAGKSGKIKIRFDYENHAKERVKVKGENYDVTTPFAMISAMILPSDTFTNVQVTNGQVMTDGDKNIVVGLAFPGLSDSLRLEEYEKLEDISLPDYVEVTADARDFSLGLTLTAASTGMLDELDAGSLDSADDLKKEVEKLTDASTQLVDGSKELLEGLRTLSGSADTYVDGVSDADEGAKELKKGLKTLVSKKKELKKGADDLSEGLDTLKKGTAALKDGIKEYTGGVSTLDQGLSSAESGTKTLAAGADTLEAGMKEYTDGAKALKEGIDTLYTQLSALENVSLPDEATLTAVKQAAGQLEEDAKALQQNAGAVTSAIEAMNQLSSKVESHNQQVEDAFADAKTALDGVDEKASEQASAQIKKQEEALRASATAQALAQAKAAVDGQDSLTAEEKSALKSALDKAISVDVDVEDVTVDGAADEAKEALGNAPTLDISAVDLNLSDMENLLSDMKTQAAVLESFAKSTAQLTGLTDRLPALSGGVASLKEGADSLTGNSAPLLSGMKTLQSGLDSLSSGVSTMRDGAAQLTGNNDTLNDGAGAADKGVGQLQSGSKKLKKGIAAYGKGVGSAYSGAGKLADGTEKLSGAGSLLTDGIVALVNGAADLSGGMTQFDTDGVQKIADLAGDDLQDVLHRAKAVKKADGRYDSFAGKRDDTEGSVRFIIETAAVETEEE